MADTGQGRVKALENYADDMRSLTSCKICLKPFYEPYILACGHTYCYGCLKSWFGGGHEDRRKRQNCPDCRTEVVAQPAPNYLLRDLVHLFINRAELLPEDETVEEHRQGMEEEAATLATDKANGGLFGGIFKSPAYIRIHHPLIDHEDHVQRCPDCAWELEDGHRCSRCGWSLEDDGFSDSYDSEFDHDFSELSGSDGFDELRGGPQRFYGIHSDADDTGSDVDEYGTPRVASIDLDHYDENDDFIDNGEYSDEVDHDDIDGLSPVSLLTAGEDFAGDVSSPVLRSRQHIRIPDGSSQISEDEAETNYDESDEDIIRTNARRPSRRGRNAILISDDEDEEDSDGHDDDDISTMHTGGETATDLSTTNLSDSGTDSVPEDDDDDDHTSQGDESDNTVIPPQPRNRRRQRLDSHRARRTPQSGPFGYTVQIPQQSYGRPNRNARPAPRRTQVGYVY